MCIVGAASDRRLKNCFYNGSQYCDIPCFCKGSLSVTIHIMLRAFSESLLSWLGMCIDAFTREV